MKSIDRQQALELIPLVVDEEADSEQRELFLEYIREDAYVRKIFESQKRIKRLLQKRFKTAKAPAELRERIHKILEKRESAELNEEIETPEDDPASAILPPTGGREKTDGTFYPDKEENTPVPVNILQSGSNSIYRVAVGAAVILLITVLTLEFLDRFSPVLDDPHRIEELAYTHFNDQLSELQTAGWQPPSLDDAHLHLINEYGLDIQMPEIDGATLDAVTYADFAPDFKTPVLQYYHGGSDEYIVVFAFKVDSLKTFGTLERDPKAVETCESYDDFHILNVQDKDVVSWKWGENWYAAVSNHNGQELVAIIRPQDNGW